MHASTLRLAILLLAAGCRAEPATRAATPAAAAAFREARSPDGGASLLLFDGDTADRVLLAVRGDTSEVFSWNLTRTPGIEWLSSDLGRVHLPVGGNHHSASVYVQPSSGRVSPMLDDAVAADGAAGTAATFDVDAFILRDLWSGRELAAWRPADRGLAALWESCEPAVTLSGRTGTLRYDCGDGPVERAIEW